MLAIEALGYNPLIKLYRNMTLQIEDRVGEVSYPFIQGYNIC